MGSLYVHPVEKRLILNLEVRALLVLYISVCSLFIINFWLAGAVSAVGLILIRRSRWNKNSHILFLPF